MTLKQKSISYKSKQELNFILLQLFSNSVFTLCRQKNYF